MNICQFFPTDSGAWRCSVCGVVRQQSSLRACGGGPQPPSAKRRLVNFSLAAIAHVCRGMPTCDQSEIDARLAICRTCPLFSGTACNHTACGCHVGRQKKFLNKLAWADQHCPIEKW